MVGHEFFQLSFSRRWVITQTVKRELMRFTATALGLIFALGFSATAADRVIYKGKQGPGAGKKIVFLSGDEEYRSEEGLPMLAKILAERHGFDCTVLFSQNSDGTIAPTNSMNIPGMETLADADMLVMLLRFRELPDDKMKYFVDYLNAGKPIMGLRTSTHAWYYQQNKQSPYARFSWNSKEWPGGFGQQVLGDTWISHHGNHAKESTRGVINEQMKNHPVLRGVEDVWGPTDVYGIAHLPRDAKVLVYGQVLEGMKPADKPVTGKKNDPMMPLVWIREYKGESGNTNRIVTTTMGASVDLENKGLRRLLVNGVYWAVHLEDKIPEKSNIDYVGEYKPTFFGFGKHQKGVKPEDLEMK